MLFVSVLALSVSHSFDSSPKGGALGKTANVAWTAKASHSGRGGIALAMTERASPLLLCNSLYFFLFTIDRYIQS